MADITREEKYLSAIAGEGSDIPNPITREEQYLAAMAGMDVDLPTPITRKEQYLKRIADNGGGSSPAAPDKDPEGLETATRLTLSIPRGRQSPRLGFLVDGSAEIYWGDGAKDTVTGTRADRYASSEDLVFTVHNYATPGVYRVYIKPVDNAVIWFWGEVGGEWLVTNPNAETAATSLNMPYRSMLREVRFGAGIGLWNPLKNAYSLQKIEYGADQVGQASGAGTHPDIQEFEIPDVATSLGLSAFSGWSGLAYLKLSNSLTTISGSIQSSSSSGTWPGIIDMAAFDHVPTLSSSSAFDNLISDCQIWVPAALLEDFKSATNWSNYADRFVGV